MRENIMIRLEKENEHREVENLVREGFWNVYRPGCLEHYVLHKLRNDPAFVPLTVFQSIPLDGIVIVTSPQELVSMIVEKAVNMAGLLSVPIIGIVENMSYFVCPNCNEKHYIFGKLKVEEEANKYGIKHTATLQRNPSLA